MDVYKRVQTAYDQIVSEFAKRNHFNMADNLVALVHELIQHVGQNGRLVDVGCGTGRDMAWFESKGITVTGIDLSMGMLVYARENVLGDLVSMNMRNLGFCDAYFDGVWCCASLLHLPKTEAAYALQEMHHILKPDGMLILSIQEGNSENWEDGFVPDVKRFFARYQADEMRNILSTKGFSILREDSAQTVDRKWLSFVCIAE